jgi:peptidoglycan/LPS O-acetylase OafA/YrhL
MNTQLPIKINSLTGLRALLAGMVLLVHGADIVGWLQGSTWLYTGVGNLGHFGVMGFFILSGLILTIVYDQREWTLREFFTNRFACLYPLYVSAIIFSFCLDWFGANASQVSKLEALLLTLGGGQAWFPFANGRFNGPSWTISVELFFYCCFPFLFWLKSRSGFQFRVLVLFLFIGTVALWDSSQFLTSWECAVPEHCSY